MKFCFHNLRARLPIFYSIICTHNVQNLTLYGYTTILRKETASDSSFSSLDDVALPKWGLLFTHCILVDSSTVIYWTSPFVILGVSDLL